MGLLVLVVGTVGVGIRMGFLMLVVLAGTVIIRTGLMVLVIGENIDAGV